MSNHYVKKKPREKLKVQATPKPNRFSNKNPPAPNNPNSQLHNKVQDDSVLGGLVTFCQSWNLGCLMLFTAVVICLHFVRNQSHCQQSTLRSSRKWTTRALQETV